MSTAPGDHHRHRLDVPRSSAGSEGAKKSRKWVAAVRKIRTLQHVANPISEFLHTLSAGATRSCGMLEGGRPRPHSIPYREWISSAPKKYGISNAADSTESEPCTALASMEDAKSLRMVPGAALAGSVAPIRSRSRLIALSPSSTIGRHGPPVMNLQRLA